MLRNANTSKLHQDHRTQPGVPDAAQQNFVLSSKNRKFGAVSKLQYVATNGNNVLSS